MKECDLGTRKVSPYVTTGCEKILLPHKLVGEEANFLNCFFDDFFFMKLMNLSTSSVVARDAVISLFSHVAFENPEISGKIIEYSMKQATRAGPEELVACLKALRSVLLLPDELQKERIDQFVPRFIELVTKWVPNSYIAFNYVTDTFIDLAYKSPLVLAALKNPANKLTFLKDWLSSHDYPDNTTRVSFLFLTSPLDVLDPHNFWRNKGPLRAVPLRLAPFPV